MIINSVMAKYEVKTPMGDKLGKVEDLILDLDGWKIKDIQVTRGTLRKEHFTVDPKDVQIKKDKEELMVSPEAKHEIPKQEMPTEHRIYLSDLMKRKVRTKDDKELGKIYDVEVATELADWKVWKVMIKTGMTKRRLRIKPDRIENVGGSMVVDMDMEEIERLSTPEIELEHAPEPEEMEKEK